VANHKGPRSKNTGQPPPAVGDLSAKRVEERTTEEYAEVLGQKGPVAMHDKRVMRVPTPSPPLQVAGGLALSYSEKIIPSCLHPTDP
jgi:hypothetical protein